MQIKNPNSKYQSLDGMEHKVFSFIPTFEGATYFMTCPMEYEAEPIDTQNEYVSAYKSIVWPKHRRRTLDGMTSTRSRVHTILPRVKTRWLKLSPASRDTSTGY